MVRMSVCGTEYEGSTPSARQAHSLMAKRTAHNGCNGGSNPSGLRECKFGFLFQI